MMPKLDIRFLSYGSVISTYTLIVLGGLVSSTGSGLACPDWPTCNGQVVPLLSGPVLIEFTHRVFALVVSVFVIGTALVAWRNYRTFRGVVILSTAAFFLLITQILLGMVTVRSELNPFITTAHLGLASGVFGVVLANAVQVRNLRPKNNLAISLQHLAE